MNSYMVGCIVSIALLWLGFSWGAAVEKSRVQRTCDTAHVVELYGRRYLCGTRDDMRRRLP